MKIRAAILALSSAFILTFACASAAFAQAYPTKPVHIIAGFPPGGSVDSVARIIADGLAKELGQPVVVENRTGATGTIAANTVATSKPDGYMLLLVPGGHALYSATLKTIPFDPAKGFEWISHITGSPFFVIVPGKSEVKSLADLIEKARNNPEKFTFGSVGIGSPHHLGVELLSLATGAKFVHVPFRGEGPVVAALLGSEVDFAITTPLQAIGNVESGKVRALAATTKGRSSRLPDVPTVEQALNIKEFDVASWFALAAPAGTPKAIIDRLHSALSKVVAIEDYRKRLAALGGDPKVSSPDEMRDRVLREQAMWSRVVQAAGVPKQ